MRSVSLAILITVPAWSADVVSTLHYAARLGGSGHTAVAGVAADSAGNVWVTGSTAALDFPTVNAWQPKPGGSSLLRIDGTVSSWSLDPSIQALNTLAASPVQPGLVFGIDPNGLHKSTDGGDTWALVTSVPSLPWYVIPDPVNPAVLYVSGPGGLFRSADGGLTWTGASQGLTVNQNSVPVVAVDPSHAHILLAFTGRTLFRSTDAGATWSPVFGTVQSFTFDGGRPGVAIAVIATSSGPQLEESTDDGATWAPRGANPLPGFGIFPDPFRPGTLYTTQNQTVLRSTDDGFTWSSTKIAADYAGLFAADPATKSIYVSQATQLARSTDGFATAQPAGPGSVPQLHALTAGASMTPGAPGRIYAATTMSSDLFIVKLGPEGNVLYSTFFGGSSTDNATAIAVDASGNVYVTGVTTSADFPVTTGAYLTTMPPTPQRSGLALFGPGASFLLKLAPDGSLAYSTYVTDSKTIPNAIAVNASGEAYLAGVTSGDLPVTPGVVQSQISPSCGFVPCTVTGGGFGPGIFQSAAQNGYLTHINSTGSGLVASTYWGDSNVEFDAISVDANGAAYLAMGDSVYVMPADASSILASAKIGGAAIAGLALDPQHNVYVTGSTSSATFYTSPGAFQTMPVPVVQLPGQGTDPRKAFVTKLGPGLGVLYSTLLDGENYDVAMGIAVDANGIATVAGATTSKAFPLKGAFQGSFSQYYSGTFSTGTGFVTRLSADGSALVYSTYAGDTRPFMPWAVTLDASGNAVFVGYTYFPGNAGTSVPVSLTNALDAFVARIDTIAAPPAVVDSVTNVASHWSSAVAPDETFAVNGHGFGTGAQVLLDGVPLAPLSVSNGQITAAVPPGYQPPANGASVVSVKSGGTTSNTILVPAAPAAPGIFSMDGSGVGQGLILNADLTVNSPSNPTSEGGIVTILATGAGVTSRVNQSDIPALPVSVTVDGFYANGVDAHVRQFPGLPGDVFELTVYVPHPADFAASNPNLANFKMPPTVPVVLYVGGVPSQIGISLSVK